MTLFEMESAQFGTVFTRGGTPSLIRSRLLLWQRKGMVRKFCPCTCCRQWSPRYRVSLFRPHGTTAIYAWVEELADHPRTHAIHSFWQPATESWVLWVANSVGLDLITFPECTSHMSGLARCPFTKAWCPWYRFWGEGVRVPLGPLLARPSPFRVWWCAFSRCPPSSVDT